MPIESHPLRPILAGQPVRAGLFALALLLTAGCTSNPSDAPPPTIEPAQAAVSPPVTATPDGDIRELRGRAVSTVFEPATSTLAVLTPGPEGQSTLSLLTGNRARRDVTLMPAATALSVDGKGDILASTRGGYFRVDAADPKAGKIDVDGAQDVEFTAIALRADGNPVLGTSDGAVYTLAGDRAVAARLKIFARVDALVTQGNTAVVLDRGQTSVTAVNASGTSAAQALRAGEGATTMAADARGRVLVADTRGDELMVFGTDPLIMRQRYPVPAAPYGLAGSPQLAWVSQTATNTVIGYDLSTGIPVEKVRYRTVQQPNSLAYDDKTDTLYVVSGSGAGVQVIRTASGRR
ncbi:YncE family protein [Mycolicibacterium setense]|uniref:YncE family protein n=1 Tax=Mycolicibacterium setense TaxID=431269 RepID=UPI000AC92ADF